jgi:hypothetical protein
MIVVIFSRYNSPNNSIPVLVPHINRTRNTVPILELKKKFQFCFWNWFWFWNQFQKSEPISVLLLLTAARTSCSNQPKTGVPASDLERFSQMGPPQTSLLLKSMLNLLHFVQRKSIKTTK